MSPHISANAENRVPSPGPLPTTVMPGPATGGMDEVLTKKSLAERLHVTVRTIENWQRRGVLDYVKVGKIVIFVWGDVMESLRRFRVSRRTCK
jgi:hypothetical protein